MELGLHNKRAIVTGASKGIGLATAIQLASEGAEVALIARNEGPLKEAAKQIMDKTGKESLIIVADVSVEAEVYHAVSTVVERFGGIDILVNNAGTMAGRPFDAVDSSAWSADLDLKLFGAVHFARAALPYLQQDGGAIVNVTSIGGKTPSGSSLPSSVSRAAGLALTKAMSKDLAAQHIRVNAVCIGSIRSDQIEKLWRETSPHQSWEQYTADPKHQIPLGRFGEAEEAANVITFLVSEAASYVTGVAINIDGGKSASL